MTLPSFFNKSRGTVSFLLDQPTSMMLGFAIIYNYSILSNSFSTKELSLEAILFQALIWFYEKL